MLHILPLPSSLSQGLEKWIRVSEHTLADSTNLKNDTVDTQTQPTFLKLHSGSARQDRCQYITTAKSTSTALLVHSNLLHNESQIIAIKITVSKHQDMPR